MNPRVRPLVLALVVAGLIGHRPPAVLAGNLLPIVACDSLVTTGATSFDFFIWARNGEVCRTELRPFAGGTWTAQPIVGWQMPDGWTAEWLPGEPGAIAIVGCAANISPVLRIVLANPSGGIEARFFDRFAAPAAYWTGVFQCAGATVPTVPTTWGGVKADYRK